MNLASEEPEDDEGPRKQNKIKFLTHCVAQTYCAGKHDPDTPGKKTKKTTKTT